MKFSSKAYVSTIVFLIGSMVSTVLPSFSKSSPNRCMTEEPCNLPYHHEYDVRWKEGSVEQFEEHVQNRTHVVARDCQGNTILHKACMRPYAIKTLLENGADVDARDCDTMTPLSNCASKPGTVFEEELELSVRLLLACGADPNKLVGFYYRRTPLHLAVGWGHKGVVKALIEKGADVNAVAIDPLGRMSRPMDFAMTWHYNDQHRVEEAFKKRYISNSTEDWAKERETIRKIERDKELQAIDSRYLPLIWLLEERGGTFLRESVMTPEEHARGFVQDLKRNHGYIFPDHSKKYLSELLRRRIFRLLKSGEHLLPISCTDQSSLKYAHLSSLTRARLKACLNRQEEDALFLLEHGDAVVKEAKTSLTAHEAGTYLFGQKELNSHVAMLLGGEFKTDAPYHQRLIQEGSQDGCSDLLNRIDLEQNFVSSSGVTLTLQQLLLLFILLGYYVA